MSAATATRPMTSLPTSTKINNTPTTDLRQAALRKNMAITQTYYLAHKARGKLSREAAQPDHDLRLLVGHANLLDSLMLELADAEREQERWFNQSVRSANTTKKPATKTGHVQWADRIAEEEEEFDDDSSDSDSDLSDDDEFDVGDVVMSDRRPAATPKAAAPVDEDMVEDDLEEDYAQLELVRTPSHTNSPPELVDHDSESEEDDMPPSPRSADAIALDPKKEAAEQDSEFYDEDLYRPAGLVSAISVY